MEPFFFIFISMGKFVNKLDYERFVKSLKGPLKSLNGEIYYVASDTLSSFGCFLNIVIRETQVQPDIIFKLMTELAEKFKPMYDEYMDQYGSGMGGTMVRIKDLLLTGGLDEFIGINLNSSMDSVLPVEKLQWVKEVRQVKTIMTFLEDPVGFRSVMELDDTTLERVNRSLKQLQSQKNVPHNLQVHLDFIEEGTIDLDISNGTDNSNFIKNIYYKLPENIKLKFVCVPGNHNKITGMLDFDWKSIYVEFPLSPEVGRTVRDTISSVLSDKIKEILKSNDLTPVNFSSNSTHYDRAHFNFSFKWVG